MQKWVQRSGADPVAMMFQFLHHGETEERFALGVNEHMNANKTCENIPLMC